MLTWALKFLADNELVSAMIKARAYLLFCLICLGAMPLGAETVVFQWQAPKAQKVQLCINSNHWKPVPLAKQASGKWRLALDLPPGRYEYVYLVDQQWAPDPDKPLISDGLGSFNNLIYISK